MVGNGAHITCSGKCPDVPIEIQGQEFVILFYLLSIEGADVVLGIEWLRTLGPIVADFAVPTMSFSHNKAQISLKGDPLTLPTPSTYTQFCHLIQTDAMASLHLLTFLPSQTHDNLPSPNIEKSEATLDNLNPKI
jgi:hypothetical protein